MALLPFTQRKLRSQIPARIPDQSSHDADQDHNHNQAGGKLQTHATPEPLTVGCKCGSVSLIG